MPRRDIADNTKTMKTTHSFVAPVLNSTQSKVNTEAYEQAIDNYNEGKHLEAFRLLLDHLNPEFRTKYGNAEGTEFHIPHGSILVNIRIAERKAAHKRGLSGAARKGPRRHAASGRRPEHQPADAAALSARRATS